MRLKIFAFITLSLLFLLICILLLIDIGRAPLEPGKTFLTQHDGLITGGLAVLAAFITILVMLKTDANAQRRHEEIRRFDVRPLRVLAEQTVMPQLLELEHLATSIKISYQKPPTEPREKYLHCLMTASFISADTGKVVEILRRQQFRDGQKLFDGFLLHACRRLEEEISEFADVLDRLARLHNDMVKNKSLPSVGPEEERDGAEMEAAVDSVQKHLGTVIAGLNGIKRLFFPRGIVKYWAEETRDI